MDDILSEFLTETTESLDVIDVELVRFEQEPNNSDILEISFVSYTPLKEHAGS